MTQRELAKKGRGLYDGQKSTGGRRANGPAPATGG